MPNPAHHLDRYAFRAGELRSPDESATGHVLVLPIVFWTKMGGHLWWRRWGSPLTTADVLVSTRDVEPSFQFAWYWGDVLNEMLDLWDAGRCKSARTSCMRSGGWMSATSKLSLAASLKGTLIKSVWVGHRCPVQADAGAQGRP